MRMIFFFLLFAVAACGKDVQQFEKESPVEPAQSVQPEITAEPCIRHEVNCPAPGRCGLFEDNNKNGICDASEVQ